MSRGLLASRVVGSGVIAQGARRLALEIARRIRIGRLTVVLPDGSRRSFGTEGPGPTGELHLHDPLAAWQMLLGGEIGAGESYMEGRWSSPDLPALLKLAALNREALDLASGWIQLPLRVPKILAHRARRNTLGQSRSNIRAHYDLGNDFYRLFLDETLTYSSAVFASDDQPLADAQRNKYRIIAERADLAPGMHVLEIGTGWGGFSLYAAGELGCRVTTITISEAQHRLARQRVHEAGLDELVSVELRDYREVTGTYDAIVSIEMLEAVGAEYFGTFFGACDRALPTGGKVSLQTITLPDVGYEPQRRGVNWIQTYIFPGGLLPSLAEVERSLHGTRLLLTASQDIAPHYARTLAAWRDNLLAHRAEVMALGLDERFLRMWEYYLAQSEAGFATGLIGDQQIVLEKRRGLAA
jgi:cyclopropane-fatty-acyl-phospholipid synthase